MLLLFPFYFAESPEGIRASPGFFSLVCVGCHLADALCTTTQIAELKKQPVYKHVLSFQAFYA
jgi:hypothetical protein